MSTPIENIAWTDASGLCCIITADGIAHGVTLVGPDGVVVRHAVLLRRIDLR